MLCSEKAIKARLEALEQQRRGSDAMAALEAAAEAERGGDEEEAEREAWQLQADLAALQSAEALGSTQQEVAILRHAAALPPGAREQEARERAARGPPPDLVRQLAAAAGNLSSAGVQRERLAAGVFRPGHELPTMSVEQFGELEYRRCAGGRGGDVPGMQGVCCFRGRWLARVRRWRALALTTPLSIRCCSMLEQQQREGAAKERHDAAEAAKTAEEREEEEVQKVGVGRAGTWVF